MQTRDLQVKQKMTTYHNTKLRESESITGKSQRLCSCKTTKAEQVN